MAATGHSLGYPGNIGGANTLQLCTGTFGMTYNGPRFTDANIVTLCNAQGC